MRLLEGSRPMRAKNLDSSIPSHNLSVEIVQEHACLQTARCTPACSPQAETTSRRCFEWRQRPTTSTMPSSASGPTETIGIRWRGMNNKVQPQKWRCRSSVDEFQRTGGSRTSISKTPAVSSTSLNRHVPSSEPTVAESMTK